ncbi:MAG: triose-phosphate isomerase [Bacteroidetes bacterium GWE2_39_28]|nr:MAG: triose-phosphate isomerase [Bacteroidetes bacterium GWE2_39_28]OFY12772.1 MAG: triose-phosphate isomerase [Bacteroidetes bacterium GWF2_39_10]OFZ08310.1 MAG: triose-phosphate isomerase [Bacteroidetes bacterium RIFOXYB2_FULL_39_7]OFZ10997.1 MAG: triose-phosphate isomerase [Bacteroidetes bacterium RIFOXYC2_FULL_39_11]HCT93756.1 triose-phosphate isomerase [Rikenellaceae bacterium]
MRKKIVAGNWKMNTSIAEGILLAKQINFLTKELETEVEVIIAPPYTHLAGIASLLKQEASRVSLSAQNCADQLSGAYTGEVSVKMLEDVGCKYVIIGHSERREYYGETNEILLRKIELALAAGLSPIYCVGEKLNEREENRHFEVVAEQIKEVLYKLKGFDMNRVVVAYEPVWAIGTGKTATSDQAEEMHAYIRRVIGNKFPTLADEISILYGGSCKPSNAAELFGKENVDGGLIGGASLLAQDFISIIKAF